MIQEFFARVIKGFKVLPKRTGRVIVMSEHSEWGNSISWFDYKRRRLMGHLSDRPVVGDVVHSKMESGKIAEFVILEVEYMHDPFDQFFATTSSGVYVEDAV